MKNKALFVWDFHGVLEKGNEYAVRAICNRVLNEFGIKKKISIEDTRKLYGLSWNQYYLYLAPGTNEGIVQKMCIRSIELSKKVSGQYIKPMDHSKTVLASIKSKGHVNVLISNTNQPRIIEFAESVGLKSFFDELLGVYTLSDNADVVTNKTVALTRYLKDKIFSKIIKIGDKETDIEVGKSIGATTYLFSKNNVHTNADYVIDDLRKVLKEI